MGFEYAIFNTTSRGFTWLQDHLGPDIKNSHVPMELTSSKMKNKLLFQRLHIWNCISSWWPWINKSWILYPICHCCVKLVLWDESNVTYRKTHTADRTSLTKEVHKATLRFGREYVYCLQKYAHKIPNMHEHFRLLKGCPWNIWFSVRWKVVQPRWDSNPRSLWIYN